MICEKCGHQNKHKTMYCENCGGKLPVSPATGADATEILGIAGIPAPPEEILVPSKMDKVMKWVLWGLALPQAANILYIMGRDSLVLLLTFTAILAITGVIAGFPGPVWEWKKNAPSVNTDEAVYPTKLWNTLRRVGYFAVGAVMVLVNVLMLVSR